MSGPADLEARARQSQGISHEPIYRMAAQALAARGCRGVLVDLGCGTGNLKAFAPEFTRYIGVDAVRYEGFPAGAEFIQGDLDLLPVRLSDGTGDAVAAVETIEHLENPRALMREMARLAKPGGWVAVTTPNCLSLHSLLTLAVKKQFSDFQDASYPAHITPLLESDLLRMAGECGLTEAAILYSLHGRVSLTPWHYPRALSRLFPRALSNNVLLIARRAAGTP